MLEGGGKISENLNDERHCSWKPHGCDTRRRIDDDTSRKTDEEGNCEERTDDVQTACGLLDKIGSQEGRQQMSAFCV